MAAITLRSMSEETHQYLLERQAKTKLEKKVSQYSLEQVVYNIIKEHKKLTAKKNKRSGSAE